MKRIKYILILIIIYIICSARTCNENEEVSERQAEEYTGNLIDNVKDVFASDSLSDQLLRAFEITAAEKLIDFTDYISIVSDTSLDLRFRQHAAELARDLFVSDTIELADWGKWCTEPGINCLEHLLSYSLNGGVFLRINPIQINVIKKFTSKNDSALTGKLSFNYICPSYNKQDTSETTTGRLVCDIYLLKKTRSFGKDLLRAWEVYLGDIYEHPYE